MTTWQHSTPQTADASERDCLKSLHRPRNESFSLGGLFLRLDDYRAGYRGSKKGRSVYLFTGLPRRVLLGNCRTGKIRCMGAHWLRRERSASCETSRVCWRLVKRRHLNILVDNELAF